MEKIANVVEREWDQLPNGPIETLLRVDGVDDWKTRRLEDLPDKRPIEIGVKKHIASMRLVMPLGFLGYFAEAANTAERKLVYAAVTGLAVLLAMAARTSRWESCFSSIAESLAIEQKCI